MKKNKFHITILGRTLEHLGVQMYKHRTSAIAELVANSWDAGATNVYITIPIDRTYNFEKDSIIIEDDGSGMDKDSIQNSYLVIGRNRRKSEGGSSYGRPVMGRKGIGKLAGFGIANKMQIETWLHESCNTFCLDINELKSGDGETSDVPIESIEDNVPQDVKHDTGTRLTLMGLKHTSPLTLDSLHQSLSRRFSRSVKGEMNIFINNEKLQEPSLDIEYSFPEKKDYFEEKLENGNVVKYSYSFSKRPISNTEMRGFTIYVRGKTAQAPNFFFDMEGKIRGQHGTKYLTGVITADFLDENIDDDSDIISTDRQEIDWENEASKPLRRWGEKLIQKLVNQWIELRGQKFESDILSNEEFRKRIENLDPTLQKQVSRFLKILGQADTDPERSLELGESLIRAYEYRHFHDIINDLDDFADNPDELGNLLLHLYDWKSIESRAILEIITGRLQIIDKFYKMLVDDAPETPHRIGDDNLHDLLAEYPWLLNPEWQVLTEEKRISTQLKNWNKKDVSNDEDAKRFDFLALSDEKKLVIIEIKRTSHHVELVELQRLETYKERLSKAHTEDLYMIMLCNGNLNVSKSLKKTWEDRDDGEIVTWDQIYTKNKKYYQHYKAVLEGDIQNLDFQNKVREVHRTREVIATGTVHRGKERRKKGLGGQDVNNKE